MKILLILKEPFLDRIPSLKTLVLHLASSGHKITLLTSKSSYFPAFTTTHPNLTVNYVKERTAKLELPTTVKLMTAAVRAKILNHYDLIIGGDLWGNVVCNHLKKIGKTPHLFFVLEYPQVIDERHPILSKPDILQNRALRDADIIVTHDKYHLEFLVKHFCVNPECVCLLPNASFTPEVRYKSQYLHQQFNLSEDNVILLHSGGFGKWFRCSELVNNFKNWNESLSLVFHLGRRPETDVYFNSVYNNKAGRQPEYSLNPLSNEELDAMISSADIGIALYSTEHLGYRAEQMGLAAGKIGNYLKCGLPVIATRLPSLKYLEEYGCGILIDDESQIQSAVKTILAKKEFFRENAFKCYRELWHPSNYLYKILSKINEKA
ncbi:MAG: hypothetical protein NC453_10465 [Muribaculum sp.]|nr:hypothetical protein [Muribaculum sp.]